MYQPVLPSNMKFVAISGYFYLANGLGLISEDEAKPIMPARILAETQSWCNLTVGEAKAQAASRDKNWEYAKDYCFVGNYIWHLQKAYGFAENSTDVIYAAKLQGTSISWTIGAFIYGQENPETMPRELAPQDLRGWRMATFGLGSAAALLLVIVICLLCMLCCQRRGKKDLHEDIENGNVVINADH
jgi:hypothetical protein